MKAYYIEGDKLKEMPERPCTPFHPVIEEYRGWREYLDLFKETKDPKYASAAQDEFKHMLLRLSKAITAIHGMAETEAEKAELKKFFEAMSA